MHNDNKQLRMRTSDQPEVAQQKVHFLCGKLALGPEATNAMCADDSCACPTRFSSSFNARRKAPWAVGTRTTTDSTSGVVIQAPNRYVVRTFQICMQQVLYERMEMHGPRIATVCVPIAPFRLSSRLAGLEERMTRMSQMRYLAGIHHRRAAAPPKETRSRVDSPS
ncbi:hypothetical protein BDZ97DRAFT_205810 [Flammula alnicola]|nr:hypothetical protein BDZ97DRAFT_205810 [Flammula alnicola]